MTCRELVSFLDAYLDGKLSDHARGPFDAHVAVCPECAAYLATYRGTVKLAQGAFPDLDDVVPADVPDELVRAILATRAKR